MRRVGPGLNSREQRTRRKKLKFVRELHKISLLHFKKLSKYTDPGSFCANQRSISSFCFDSLAMTFWLIRSQRSPRKGNASCMVELKTSFS